MMQISFLRFAAAMMELFEPIKHKSDREQPAVLPSPDNSETQTANSLSGAAALTETKSTLPFAPDSFDQSLADQNLPSNLTSVAERLTTVIVEADGKISPIITVGSWDKAEPETFIQELLESAAALNDFAVSEAVLTAATESILSSGSQPFSPTDDEETFSRTIQNLNGAENAAAANENSEIITTEQTFKPSDSSDERLVESDVRPVQNTAAEQMPLSSSEPEVAAYAETEEPTSFWDTVEEIDISEVKHLATVYRLYEYMSNTSLMNLLDPELDFKERHYSIINVLEKADELSVLEYAEETDRLQNSIAADKELSDQLTKLKRDLDKNEKDFDLEIKKIKERLLKERMKRM